MTNSRELLTQEFSGYHHLLNFSSAFVNLSDFGVPEHLLHREVLHVADAAAKLPKANLRLAQGRYEEARTLAVAARAILERVMPDDSWQVGAAKAVEGAALSRLRRYVEAEPLLKSSIPALGDSTISGLQQATLQCLVELYMAWGRPQEADGFR